jgi:chromosome segregation and condensation protein ScpB
MKTAMQELIEAINLITKTFKRGLSTEEILDMCNNQLDKEKEQIKEAWYNGGINGMGLFEINTGEEYYNQTYNQKIPELLYKDGTPMRKVKLSKEAQELLDEATKRFNQPNLCCTR